MGIARRKIVNMIGVRVEQNLGDRNRKKLKLGVEMKYLV